MREGQPDVRCLPACSFGASRDQSIDNRGLSGRFVAAPAPFLIQDAFPVDGGRRGARIPSFRETLPSTDDLTRL